jgi:putative tricarboxylic transport membrane protein
VALALVDGSVDSTVNNPIEVVTGWKEGELRPLCVFDNKPLQQSEKIAEGLSWSDIPTCKSQGIDVEYLMLRGVFTTPGATPEQVAFYVDVLKKVRETPEWQALMTEGAFNQTFLTGPEFGGELSFLEPALHDFGRWISNKILMRVLRRGRCAPWNTL